MTRLVLLPGLGADERMFQTLGPTGFTTELRALPDPEPGCSLSDYAAFVQNDLLIGPSDWIGGCSFGSMVATEIARQTPAAAVVLLAGATDSSAVPAWARWLGQRLQRFPVGWIRTLSATDLFMNLSFNHPDPEIRQVLQAMLRDTSDVLLKEGLRLSRTSFNAVLPACPLYAIHGTADRVLKMPELETVHTINGAGHALVGTHASEVTAFLDNLYQDFIGD